MQKILIYTPKITSRIQYIFDFVWNEFSGVDFELTTNLQFFEASDFPKINYSKEKISDEIHLISDGFMFENGISGNVKFKELNEIGKLFFSLSRYEEYLPQEKDIHGRISGKGKVYKTPFVDEWILKFQEKFKFKYSELEFKKREFEMVLTCDVDQVWKYKNKGFKRTYGTFLKDLIKLDWREFKKRKNVISGKEVDDYDTFEVFKILRQTHNDKKLQSKFRMIFFWLMANYGKFDKNNPFDNSFFQNKIKEISKWAEIGIHPSYASNSNLEKLKTEIRRLEKISGQKITKSRQHFIKLDLPETYQNLIQKGIEEDYTMAYADETGFRAGTCTPFYWYDLRDEIKTNLKVHSFCAMDVTLRNYMKLNPEQALAELFRLKSEIQKVNGQMITLFHNSNFNGEWNGWKEVLENFIK
ncbi:polysaccharide deacetylase family protein [Moheibacter sediminis]|uniref:DUF7033 domain-containing protein n=1 Tax=Moheibacter sediminis TaxID=1434700 RepID=A0A1W1YHJ6_9FLAO|nr:polysaccharide deacetylase family protein [Moheibacter sediminis]SMC35613.1 hypothetical protein SAMN06296427_101374 [Moheibacter sediminis]